MMKTYEVVWEIFNQCSGNQMRDVFIDEIETDDMERVVREKFKGKEVSYEKETLKDGTVVFEIIASGMKERMSFTEV